MGRATSSRVYAGTTGQCLLRDTDAVDEAERTRAVDDFEAGLRLVVDPVRAEVRGVVPVVRSSDEAFVFVVDVSGEPNPIRQFARTVLDTVGERDGWSLDERADTTRALRIVHGGETPGSSSDAPAALPAAGEAAEYPDLVAAVSALDRAFEGERGTTGRTLVVATAGRAAHIDDDAGYLVVGSPDVDDATVEETEATPPAGTRRTRIDSRSAVVGTGVFAAVTVFWGLLVGTVGVAGVLLAAGLAVAVAVAISRRAQ